MDILKYQKKLKSFEKRLFEKASEQFPVGSWILIDDKYYSKVTGFHFDVGEYACFYVELSNTMPHEIEYLKTISQSANIETQNNLNEIWNLFEKQKKSHVFREFVKCFLNKNNIVAEFMFQHDDHYFPLSVSGMEQCIQYFKDWVKEDLRIE